MLECGDRGSSAPLAMCRKMFSIASVKRSELRLDNQPSTSLLRRCVDRARSQCRAWIGRRRLQREIRAGAPLRLVIGSGNIGQAGWIRTDIEYLNLLQRRDWQRYFLPDMIAAILAEHVWEHLSAEDGLVAARTCYEYLRPGGYLRIAVPDGHHPDPEYIQRVRPGGTGPGAHDHKVLYTVETLGQLLVSAGFDVRPLEYFDAEGRFCAQAWDPDDGLIRRSQKFDARNHDGKLRYTSLIIDAHKKIPGRA
jgi:predicted SAM-dependent methyltransferase